jgi:hypothetical protein
MDENDAQPGDSNKKSAKDQCQMPSRQPVEPIADPIRHRFPALSGHQISRISVDPDFGDQVMQAAIAAVRDPFEPA